MKTLLSRTQIRTRIACIVAAGLAVTIGSLSAQAQSPNPAGLNASKHGFAVVDISYIFKEHARFRSTMDAMKKEMEGIEAELKADRDRIAQTEQERNRHNVGSAEYKKFDEEVARMMAEFNLKMTRLRKDFLEREAKVYYQTYLEVCEAVGYYAKRHNIGLVIRFNGEPVDPNRREDVLREINKPVPYQDNIDITPDVLALLNRDQATAPAVGARPPGQPGSTQLPPRSAVQPGSTQLPPR